MKNLEEGLSSEPIKGIETGESSDLIQKTKGGIHEILNVVSLETLIYKRLKLSNGHVISVDGTKYVLDSVSDGAINLLKKLDGSNRNIPIKISRKDFTDHLKAGKVNILNRQRDSKEKASALDSAKKAS